MSEFLLSEVWLSALVALHISFRNSSWGCICASVAMLTGTITLRKVILVDCQRHLVLIQNKNWKQYITIINVQEGFGSIRFGLVSSPLNLQLLQRGQMMSNDFHFCLFSYSNYGIGMTWGPIPDLDNFRSLCPKCVRIQYRILYIRCPTQFFFYRAIWIPTYPAKCGDKNYINRN